MYTKQLQEFVAQYQCDQQGREGFNLYLENYQQHDPKSFAEDFKGIDLSDITLELFKVTLNCTYYDSIEESISVYHDVFSDSVNIGRYICDYNLDGEIIDDTLKLY